MSFAHGLGWLPDLPDNRDLTDESKRIQVLLKSVGVANAAKASLPRSVDLREWCSPVEDQETLGSCTANAGVGLLEYFERRAFGRHLDASRLFLYKATRNLMSETGDSGAYIRETMKAMVLFGVPPEEYWPYDISQFDVEPSAFCYAFAQNYKAIQYYRLDPVSASPASVLQRVKANLAAGLPAMFGFTTYSSLFDSSSGLIPYPSPNESAEGGHAVVAIGYDDDMEIPNPIDKTVKVGAILIRNSWGKDWGGNGYGWLPYEYILKGDAIDWWSLIKSDWVDTSLFSL